MECRTTNTKANGGAVLLRKRNRLQFAMNVRNMSNGIFTFFPTTNLIECKAISVDWALNRRIFGVQSEDSPQTPMIDMQN